MQKDRITEGLVPSSVSEVALATGPNRGDHSGTKICWIAPVMYIVGQEEIDALAKVINGNALFRYGVGNECDRFEARYAQYLGCKHFALAASGSNALAAAMIGVGLGPGDEVLIPAHTYMATATSVLAAGAIPVIVDIDETLTLDPEAIKAAIGPSTKAVVPFHMWGTACNMNAIMAIARPRNLMVIE